MGGLSRSHQGRVGGMEGRGLSIVFSQSGGLAGLLLKQEATDDNVYEEILTCMSHAGRLCSNLSALFFP